jgi:site-specific recombinase XerD
MQLTLPNIAPAPRGERSQRRRPAPAAAPALGELEEAFLKTLAWDPTRTVYRQDLASYCEWCEAERVDPVAISREQLDRWREWMLHDQVDGRTAASPTPRIGLSGSVVRKRIGVVSQFFEYLIKEHRLRDDNPAQRIERPLAEDPDGPPARWLSTEETNRMLDAAEAIGEVEHALACLLFCYGQPAVHVGELRGRDVFQRDGHPYIQLTVRKGRKLAQPLVGRTHSAILALGELAPDQPLVWLPGNPGRDAFRRRVMRIVVACARDAGIQDVTLIVVRHTWQAHARLAGVPEPAIVHHSGIEWSALEQWRKSAEAEPAVAVERYLAGAA